MQWDKVKNILIAILLTINLFLLGNLAVRGWQSHRRTSELEANLRTLVSARGMQLDTAFSFPEDITLPELSLDRSRADEEKIAAAMLGEHAERTEQEDGTVRFESDRGTLKLPLIDTAAFALQFLLKIVISFFYMHSKREI